MASYIWKDGLLSVTLSDAEGAERDLEFDPMQSPQEVRDAAMRFGFATALRNSTAGKMDDLEVARKLLLAKAATFSKVWAEAKDGKAKVELTADEIAGIVGDVIVRAKQAKGDKRAAADILAAFNARTEDERKATIASLKSLIDKAMKQRLKDKKAAAKLADDDSMRF